LIQTAEIGDPQNYWLGRFGYQAHPAVAAEDAHRGRRGNYALLNQIATMEWVLRRISVGP
jgi:carboxylesterase type B